MITKVVIERFKSIQHIELKLQKVNVLVGTNNSGKSSIIQALQLATSVAQAAEIYAKSTKYKNNKKSTSLAQEQLIYAPSKDVYSLGYITGNLAQDPEKGIKVSFYEDTMSVKISISRGKNKNIAASIEGEEIGHHIELLDNPYCMYVTGLAGIPFEEEIRTSGAVRRSAAKGDSNTVFRNVLYQLKNNPEKWTRFLFDFHTVFPDIEIDVTADPNVDGIINVNFHIEGSGTTFPIDLAGTGVLQAIQISAYINYFNPKLLLLDEPDSHLHPDNQRILANLIVNTAQERELRVIISTHSRHIMNALKADAEFFLVKNGAVIQSEFSHFAGLLELGALDSLEELQAGIIKYVILTEDSKFDEKKMLQLILGGSGFSEDEYRIFSYDSISKIDSALLFAKFLTGFHPSIKVIIHRDRDALLQSEIEELKKNYAVNTHVSLFITEGNDMDAYFCKPEHVKYICESNGATISLEEAKDIYNTAADSISEASRESCCNKRVEVARKQHDQNAARIILEFNRNFEEDKTPFLNGKKLRGRIAEILQCRFGKNINLFKPSPSILDESLRNMNND